MPVRPGYVVDVFSGPVAPRDKGVIEMRDEEIIGEMEGLHTKDITERKQDTAAVVLQAAMRMWLARLRFVQHHARLKSDLKNLREGKQIRCAISIARIIRGFVCRRRYARLMVEEQARLAADAAKKGPKKGKKEPAAALAAPMSATEQLIQRNINFVVGMRAFLAGNLDEALTALEAHVKTRPDVVASRLVATIQKKKGAAASAAAGAKGSRKR